MDAPSLLNPPNPAADPVKPAASILLNAPGRPPADPTGPPLDSPSISGSSTGTSNGNAFFSSDSSQTSIPHSSPPLSSSARDPSPAPSHTSSFSSQQGSGGYYPASMTAPGSPSLGAVNRRTSTPKISFAPLPTVPPEFRRRNSISLGVASRRNLIGAQNGLPPGVQKHSGVHSVIMNDEEWEEYQRQYHERKGNDGVVDVGQLAKSGAKALWRSVKRRRSSSQTSQASTSTDSASTNLSNAQSAGSGSASGVSQQASLSTKPGGAGETMSSLHTVEEDDEHHSPPPAPAADLVRDDSGAQPLHAPLAKRPRSPGVKLTKEALAAEGLDDGDGEGGEATPRRRPSPPPRLADKLPTADELAEGREEEDDDEEDDYEDSSVGYEEEHDELSTVEEKEDISAHAHHHAQHEHHDHEHESHEERDRDRKASVLGFDVERFGLMEIGEQQHRGRR
ncbi:hypothetical protein B9479_004751 [Cryptococcus floricola]|uniref:Uncharacterized protein n=1 Tax=Cryptococcus floricola TaxID=2591691 RepID=A0A5D3AWI1_9TREE|nr:hypothetical protein B9479_004751 [Cryptococcus floricola]